MYDQLLAGKTVTVEFESRESMRSVRAQLSTYRTRFTAPLVALGEVENFDLQEGKVITFKRLGEHPTSLKFPARYSVTLSEPVTKPAGYKILSITS